VLLLTVIYLARDACVENNAKLVSLILGHYIQTFPAEGRLKTAKIISVAVRVEI
jgi:hypothetical protein